jgi:hypothetical protein
MNLITLTWTGTYEDLKQLYIAYIEADAILGDDVESKAVMVFGLMQHLTLNNNIKAKVDIKQWKRN